MKKLNMSRGRIYSTDQLAARLHGYGASGRFGILRAALRTFSPQSTFRFGGALLTLPLGRYMHR